MGIALATLPHVLARAGPAVLTPPPASARPPSHMITLVVGAQMVNALLDGESARWSSAGSGGVPIHHILGHPEDASFIPDRASASFPTLAAYIAELGAAEAGCGRRC